jgi:cyclase
MLTTRVIPCLDVRDGRIVKGVRFQSLRDAGDPASRAAQYEQDGADELVMLDVSATNEGRATAVRTVREIRRVLSIPLTVGGGIASIEDAARLLDAGADKVSINSAAVRDPDLISRLAQRFGRQCTVLAHRRRTRRSTARRGAHVHSADPLRDQD